MTEPEDLDEDLFADLYEADESTVKNPPAESSPAAPVQSGPVDQQPTEQPQYESENVNESSYVDENYQNGEGGAMETTPAAAGSPPSQAGPEKPHGTTGTGIKEDG